MANIRTDKYTPTIDGIKVPGQLTTNLDNGSVTFNPYITPIIPGQTVPVRTLSTNSLTSEWNSDKETWEWKSNGTVFEDIRTQSDNSNLFEAAFTDSEGPGSGAEKLAGKFYLEDYQQFDQTIDNNWSIYEVEKTAERGKGDVNDGASWVRSKNTADSSGADDDEPTQTTATVEFTSIPYETDENEPPKIRSSYGDYYYPSSLKTNTNKQDVIKFTLKEVIGGTINPNLGQKTFTKNYEGRDGSVTLPIQPSITDSNIVEWSGFGLGPLGSFLAGQSLDIASNSTNVASLFANTGDAFVTTLKELLDSPSSTAYQQQIKLALAEAASGTQGLLSRATGNVINENFELLFSGPQLRPFTFSFKMSPRSEDEATQVRSIIRFFKQAMSVKTSSTNVFLKSPFVFDIKYLVNGSSTVHPSINRIKTCALLGCDVDYTPDQTYMTFTDDKRTMTSYGMTLRFSEIEPVFEKDYIDNNIPEDEIGY